MLDAQPDPSVMSGVIPYLSLDGRAAEALDFYARAFGAEELERLAEPGDPARLMHAGTVINGRALMMTDSGMGGEGPPARNFGHLQLVVADGRAWWDRAVAAGCAVVEPYARQFWGDDWGLLEDPFGFRWAVLQDGAAGAGAA